MNRPYIHKLFIKNRIGLLIKLLVKHAYDWSRDDFEYFRLETYKYTNCVKYPHIHKYIMLLYFNNNVFDVTNEFSVIKRDIKNKYCHVKYTKHNYDMLVRYEYDVKQKYEHIVKRYLVNLDQYDNMLIEYDIPKQNMILHFYKKNFEFKRTTKDSYYLFYILHPKYINLFYKYTANIVHKSLMFYYGSMRSKNIPDSIFNKYKTNIKQSIPDIKTYNTICDILNGKHHEKNYYVMSIAKSVLIENKLTE